MAKLTPEQAHDWYLAGYTSKLAGTEKGVTEPAATFSACFGDAFLTHPPQRYAELLDARIAAHNPSLWLVNTGWTGGAYGTGERISIAHTRAIIRAILAGELEEVQLETEPIFGLHLPTRVKTSRRRSSGPGMGGPTTAPTRRRPAVWRPTSGTRFGKQITRQDRTPERHDWRLQGSCVCGGFLTSVQ